ncbi:MAG: toprim domain-containing protein [Actinomycetota bacterium]|nr:toprim domain-containing protein [Actinomycetota bacterium]
MFLDAPWRLGETVASNGNASAKPPDPLPSFASFEGWHERLKGDRSAYAYLTGKRGLKDETIERSQLGYDGEAIVLPVFDGHGEIVSYRRRFWPHQTGPKIVGPRGHPARLYPGPPAAEAFVLAEGELDTLLALQHGLLAVTGTAGTAWREEWDPFVRGRRIAIVYDAGAFAKAEKRAAALVAAGAREAWPLDLAVAGLEHGEDLTDWFVKYGRTRAELADLLNGARRA